MTDDLVQRLKGHSEILTHDKGKFVRFIDVATCTEAIDRIEAQAAEIERLKNQLSVETEPSPYCPICGSCGDEGCCGSKRCLYPAAEWQTRYKAGIETAVKALEDDAKKCDCFAFEERECGCGAWCEWKSITSARAVEIVRKLADTQ